MGHSGGMIVYKGHGKLEENHVDRGGARIDLQVGLIPNKFG